MTNYCCVPVNNSMIRKEALHLTQTRWLCTTTEPPWGECFTTTPWIPDSIFEKESGIPVVFRNRTRIPDSVIATESGFQDSVFWGKQVRIPDSVMLTESGIQNLNTALEMPIASLVFQSHWFETRKMIQSQNGSFSAIIGVFQHRWHDNDKDPEWFGRSIL